MNTTIFLPLLLFILHDNGDECDDAVYGVVSSCSVTLNNEKVLIIDININILHISQIFILPTASMVVQVCSGWREAGHFFE